MTLSIGGMNLNKVRKLRLIQEVRYPRHNVVGKSTGTIDDVAYIRKPDEFELICEVNESDRETLMAKINTMVALTEDATSFSKTVHVEKVECDYIIGRDYADSGPSPECWRCTVNMVLSNA